jgi:hypothetical protein
MIHFDMAIAQERLYQDYTQECELLMKERLEMAEKLKYPVVEKHLESVLELFLQFDKEESMAIYGIDFKRIQKNLVENEKP